jgi:hypothetical protein
MTDVACRRFSQKDKNNMTPIPDDQIWRKFLGRSSGTLALPDYHSNYFAYSFDWKRNPNIGLRITGEFGYARYMSYNIYDEVSGVSLKALRDVLIKPHSNNVNPYWPGADANARNRRYTVNVFCWDNASSETRALKNSLNFSTTDDNGNPVDVKLLVVMLRYYLPSGVPEAGVPLPTIEAFDTEQNRPLSLPANLVPQGMPTFLYEQQMTPIFKTVVDNTLRFYHVAGSGEYNNADNLYLLNAIKKGPGEVLLLKFQAPVHAVSNDQFAEADVRYWSINQGNKDTSTPWGVPDQDFQPAKDGLTYVAIGGEVIAAHAKKGGYNFMRWKAADGQSVILYRNLVTRNGFEGSIDNVTESDFTQHPIHTRDDPRIYNLDASNYIGNYAPTGVKVTEAEFLRDYGGMPSPGFSGG